MRSAVEPASISSEAMTRVYASMVHCIPATEVCRSSRMDGSATLSTVVSRLTISRLMQQVPRITSRLRGPHSSVASWGGSFDGSGSGAGRGAGMG